MRTSFEEPTGIRVRGADGEVATLTFPASVAALEDGAVFPDHHVWSRIVTGGQWVRAGEMRLFQLLTGELEVARRADSQTWPRRR